MAKKSMIARDKKRLKLIKKFAAKRAALKATNPMLYRNYRATLAQLGANFAICLMAVRAAICAASA